MKIIMTIAVMLGLMCAVAVCADDGWFVEYDENGNPIESTEIPADQIPPDSRPAVNIPTINTTIELAPIITEYTNATIEITPAIRDSIFTDYEGIAQGLGSMLPEIIPSQGTLKQEIQQAEQGIKDYVKFIETAHPRNYVTDQRTLAYMQNIQDTPEWRKWQAIYSATYAPIRHVPLTDATKIRMLTEMRAANSTSAYNNLIRELTYFKSLTYTEKIGEVTATYRQYNTVLAVWEGENPSRLLQQIALVKSMGYRVFFTYGKSENLLEAVFIDPDTYRQGLQRLAAECDGYILGWRRAGLHLFKQDRKWSSFSMLCAREGNANILIFGGIYQGFAGEFDSTGKEIFKLYINIPANASGVFVTNLGYAGIRPDKIFELLRQYTTLPMIAGIVGEKAYYMTRYNTHRTKAKNREIITRVEARFRNAGFGTATLAGDGSNEIYDKSVSDDLCKSQWSKTIISN